MVDDDQYATAVLGRRLEAHHRPYEVEGLTAGALLADGLPVPEEEIDAVIVGVTSDPDSMSPLRWLARHTHLPVVAIHHGDGLEDALDRVVTGAQDVLPFADATSSRLDRVIRSAIARILEADPSIRVVARVGNGRAAIDELRRTPVDVLVLDIEMPVLDGMAALPLLLRADPRLQVIMASTLTTRGADIALRALRLGAADYVPKPTSIGLKGDEKVTIRGLQGDLKPRQKLTAEIVSGDGALQRISLLCRIDTLDELDYYRNGGILHTVLRNMAKS